MGKRQKQEQTFPPQLGSTELCLSHGPGRNSTVPCRLWERGTSQSVPRLLGLEAPRQGSSRVGCGALGERQGAAFPKPGVRNRLPEGTQVCLAVTGVYSPTSGGSRQRSHFPASEGSSGMGRVSQAGHGAGAGHPCPGTQPSPCSCPQHGTAQQDMEGTHSCPQILSPTGIENSEQDLALTGNQTPAAPQLQQEPNPRSSSTPLPQSATASPCQGHRDHSSHHGTQFQCCQGGRGVTALETGQSCCLTPAERPHPWGLFPSALLSSDSSRVWADKPTSAIQSAWALPCPGARHTAGSFTLHTTPNT